MENDYRSYFDSMPCYLTVQNRELNIIDANERFVTDFGAFEGRFCYQIYKQRPEKCEICPVERTFHDGQRHRSEERVYTLDGREVWVVVYTTPIRNEAGEITAVMEMSTDVTEIKLLQKQHKESQEKYRLLFEEVPCFISMQDRDLRIVEANRFHREAFGTSYGGKCYEVYKRRATECQPCIVRHTFEDGQTRTHEEVVTSRDGERMNVIVTTAPVHNADGDIETVIEMSTDITAIRQLQSKLSDVGMIISTISHDLKGLLNGMDGGIYLVDTGLKKEDQKRVSTGWEMVLRNVDRIRSTVLDILYYAKDREPILEEIVAESVVQEVFNVMKAKAKDHNISFDTQVDPSAAVFQADAKALRSMLVNLIDNSIDACRVDKKKDTHTITFKASGLDDEVVFEVTDNGIGMDEETRQKAFTLFFSSKGSGGTGLGLFIANKIVQSHSGKIRLESEPDQGTRFVVTLPREQPKTPVTPEK
ncbi:MAG: PAS domain-containing sensor histidine kinase [candidate division Zixibacteria bacterium]|nr:PAS domain-containing sensor histidine kinase [candidate division Zixibacteria bacterium]MBU1469800.1 PAS domain-containing sensor histidine kinase [candidate division Zixibacteria bacterium]MBU2625374.1 PAS domain-containing sensor histidine kinase [candidate division Zixibacteria bacterium]